MDVGARKTAAREELWGGKEGYQKLDKSHHTWTGCASDNETRTEAAGRRLRCVYVCVLCIPVWLGSAGCSFLRLSGAFAKKIAHQQMWNLCYAQIVSKDVSRVRTNICF